MKIRLEIEAGALGLIVSIAVSRVLYHKRKIKAAIAVSMIPLLQVVPFPALPVHANIG